MDESYPAVLRQRAAHAIFCDDIRREDSGKLIIVGMYGDELVVPAFPAQLPSFHVFVTASTPTERPFQSLTLRIFFDDEQMLEMSMGQDDLTRMSELSFARNEDMPVPQSAFYVNKTRSLVAFAPFALPNAGVLRARIFTESEVIPAGGLRVRLAESQSSSSSDPAAGTT